MRASQGGTLTRRFGVPRDLAHRLAAARDFDSDASPLLRQVAGIKYRRNGRVRAEVLTLIGQIGA